MPAIIEPEGEAAEQGESHFLLPVAGEEADRLQVWLRTVSALPDGAALHAAVLAYASDLTILGTALRPHGIGFENPELITASIDHAMWFHRPARADEWLLHDQDTPSASGGRGLGRGRMFDQQGRLVATTVQEGLMRLRRPGSTQG